MSLLGCSALRDSIKPAAALSLTATVSARFELTDLASGASVVKEYASTVLTRTWTRAASSTPYEIANTVPLAGEFRLVNGCCCWKCRWTTIVRSALGAKQTGKIVGDLAFLAPWTRTEIAFTGDPPVITTGTSLIACEILFDFPPDAAPATYCQSDSEEGRVPGTARFLLSGVTGIANTAEDAMDWTYADGQGGSATGGPTAVLSLPTSGSLVRSPLDACPDLPSGFVQIDFSGDASDGDFTDTAEASLRLEFTFS